MRINIWSSPRNLSTALMYSWAQRSDTTVVDEPLYAHFLAVTGRDHPGRAEVLAAQDTDGAAVIDRVILADYDTEVVVFKQMAKHLVGLDRSFLAECRNVLLTREPAAMVASFAKGVERVDLDETGFVELVELLDATVDAGQEPIVIESGALLADPPGVLAALCRRLGLAFDPAMLSWPAGPKPYDGVWSRHWYRAVWESQGWAPPRSVDVDLEPRLAAVVDQALPYYQRLLPYVITAD